MDNHLVSPRKQMAMGSKPSGAEAVQSYPGSAGVTHVPAETGRRPELSDTARGTAGQESMGRQRAPDHGPSPDHFSRAGKA